jgi:hypothetical protein
LTIGVLLEYYDIAYDSCKVDESLERSLGYNRIFLANRDIRIIDGRNHRKNEIGKSIFISSGGPDLFTILNMGPAAVAFQDLRINKKALEQMHDRGIALCLPMSTIMNQQGLKRSRSTYMMSRLLGHAQSIKLDVSIVTLARSNTELCSHMQLVELAKLVGADEAYARRSISAINRRMVIG